MTSTIAEKEDAYQKYIQRNTRNNGNEFKSKRKQSKSGLRKWLNTNGIRALYVLSSQKVKESVLILPTRICYPSYFIWSVMKPTRFHDLFKAKNLSHLIYAHKTLPNDLECHIDAVSVRRLGELIMETANVNTGDSNIIFNKSNHVLAYADISCVHVIETSCMLEHCLTYSTGEEHIKSTGRSFVS